MAGQVVQQRIVASDESLNIGNITVAVPGTAVSLAPVSTPSVPCYEVLIQILSTNVGNIYVGGAAVDNTGGSGITLMPVAAGVQPPSIQISAQNLSQIFIDADNALEGVNFLYW